MRLAEPELPEWHRHPELGWVFGTSADINRVERETVSVVELARLAGGAIDPDPIVTLQPADVVETHGEIGWKVASGVRLGK